MNYFIFYIFVIVLCSTSCTTKPKEVEHSIPVLVSTTDSIRKANPDITYATGFSIQKYSTYTLVTIHAPWPDTERNFKYLLYPKETPPPVEFPEAIRVPIPIARVIVTATNNIPMLELLEVEEKLIGFPNTKYISSPKTRTLIDKGAIKDIGQAQSLNTEVVLELDPELLIGFSATGDTKALDRIQQNGVPVLFNGSWMEQHPLGRAEWIKCVAAFFALEDKAATTFKGIETQYNDVKTIAKKITPIPTVLSGSVYKEIWHIPGGNSYISQFFKDANVHYAWADNTKSGNLQLSFESIIDKAQHAHLWIGVGNANSLAALEERNTNYNLFDAFKNKNVYSYALQTEVHGGLKYFEMGPMHPDIILKDIIKIAHPNVLPEYVPYFFKKLE